jgi:hypothetical protein
VPGKWLVKILSTHGFAERIRLQKGKKKETDEIGVFSLIIQRYSCKIEKRRIKWYAAVPAACPR